VVRRTFGICDQVFGETGMTVRDVDAVFLAGGTTLLPELGDYVGKYFGKRPRHDINPMHVVAIGGSIVAARPGLADRMEALRAVDGG
jgi:molecular chaperone DnaK (HSP70)